MLSELKKAVHKSKSKDMSDLEMFCMEEWLVDSIESFKKPFTMNSLVNRRKSDL